MKDIKISVLVPVYNVENYLFQCIASIVSQKYKNLEIIIIDDGSTDNSGKIADEFAEADDRIKVIHKENTGYGHSMNLGLSCATGDYVGIVESDDYIAPSMYLELAEAVSENGADVVKGSYAEFHTGAVPEPVRLFNGIPCDQTIYPQNYPGIFMVPCSIWTAIYNRNFLVTNDILFQETSGAAFQDVSFSFKIWACAKKVYLIEKPYVFYRIDNMNSSMNSPDKMMCIYEETDAIDRFLENKNDSFSLWQIRNVRNFYLYQWNYLRTEVGKRCLIWGKIEELCLDIARRGPDGKYWPLELWEAYKALYAVFTQPALYYLRESQEVELDAAIDSDLLQLEKSREHAIEEYNYILIYGAGDYGKRVYSWLQKRNMNQKAVGFAVSQQKGGSPEQVMGLPVLHIGQYVSEKESILVIIAAAVRRQPDIIRKLKHLGFENIIRVNKPWRDELYREY